MTDTYPTWVILQALEEYVLLEEADRDADNLRLKIAIASNQQIQIPVDTLEDWIDFGVDVPERPDLKNPWEKLKSDFDRSVWDPIIGEIPTGVRGERYVRTKAQLEKLAFKLVRHPRFMEKITESPELLNRFLQRFGVGEMDSEVISDEQLLDMITKLIKSDTNGFLDMIGAVARRKLKEAINKYKG